MKSLYYQFVNYIQSLSELTFIIIWMLTLALTFSLIVKFFKIYNGTQKKFEKLSLLFLSVLLFVLLIYLTGLRK